MASTGFYAFRSYYVVIVFSLNTSSQVPLETLYWFLCEVHGTLVVSEVRYIPACLYVYVFMSTSIDTATNQRRINLDYNG